MRSFVLTLAVVLGLAAARPAAAFEDFAGTRATGMGGASRAWAVGDAGPLLNPSGMVLLKTYTVEPSYQFANRENGHFLHAAVVDNTSSYGVAGGLYYTYHTANPPGLVPGHGHETGFALAFPFGEYLALGGTVKYFNLSGDDATNQGTTGHTGGVTFDLGATVRPASSLSFAVVGTDIRSLHNSQAPQTIAYGAAFVPMPSLVLAADGVTSFTADNYTGRKGTSAMGGGEWIIGDRFGVRAGGGYDAASGNGYISGGVSVISEIAALDAGIREDVTRREIAPGVDVPRQTLIGVSIRLFIPASQTQPQ